MLFESSFVARNTAASLIANKLLKEKVKVIQLGEICSKITDGEHQTPQRQLLGIPLLTAKNIRDGYVDLKYTDFVAEETAEKCWRRCKPNAGDILMTCVGTIGRVTPVKEELDVVLVRSIALLTPKHDIVCSEYIAGMLYSTFVREQIQNLVKQSAQPCIYLSRIKALKIPLPSLEIQNSIAKFLNWYCSDKNKRHSEPLNLPTGFEKIQQTVAKVEELAGKIEEARSLREQTIKETESLINSALISAFEIQIKEKKWDIKPLKDLTEIARGKFTHRPRNDPRFYDGEIPFIQIGDISNSNRIIQQYSQTLNQDGLKISRMFPKGTVVIAITGATIGVTGILDFDCCFPDSIVGIVAKEKSVVSDYIYWSLEYVKKAALAEATQTTQPNINLKNLNKLKIPLPCLEEQQHIVAYLDRLQSKVDEMKRLREKSLQELDVLLPSILDKAFKGEL